MDMCYDDQNCGDQDAYQEISVDINNRIDETLTPRIGVAPNIFMEPLPSEPGGGTQTSCTAAGAMTAGAYCGFASAVGSEYCIFTKLEDERIFAASEKGVQFVTAPAYPLTEAGVCP
jgi:hypothetical protein